MTDHFTDTWRETLGKEGGYSNHNDDPGGATRWGVTQAVARHYGYVGPMEDLPVDTARSIAKKAYWDPLRLDDVAYLSPSIAAELFDTAYNCGIGTAGKFLQQSLNAFNRQESDYPDLIVDGRIGRHTIGALREYLHKRGPAGELVMMRALNSLQGARYIQVVERKAALESFVFGWFLNRIK